MTPLKIIDSSTLPLSLNNLKWVKLRGKIFESLILKVIVIFA